MLVGQARYKKETLVKSMAAMVGTSEASNPSADAEPCISSRIWASLPGSIPCATERYHGCDMNMRCRPLKLASVPTRHGSDRRRQTFRRKRRTCSCGGSCGGCCCFGFGSCEALDGGGADGGGGALALALEQADSFLSSGGRSWLIIRRARDLGIPIECFFIGALHRLKSIASLLRSHDSSSTSQQQHWPVHRCEAPLKRRCRGAWGTNNARGILRRLRNQWYACL